MITKKIGKQRRIFSAQTLLLAATLVLVACGKKNADDTDNGTNNFPKKYMFVRTPSSIVDTLSNSHIAGQTVKGDSILILDSINGRYLTDYHGVTGYVMSAYLTDSLKDALVRYDDSVHSVVRNPYGSGLAADCDFFPREKPHFKDNVMPESVYALYLNIGKINKIDSFIALAKETKINALVLDIKDNECPGFKADAFAKYTPTHYKRGFNRDSAYIYAVRRMHQEGLYAIGRITVFKDSYFVRDNPDVAISDRATGEPFLHNNAHWPSVYNRKVWQFNVELAKEAVYKFGFDEINFDYVRFPDKMQSVADQVDYHNTYNESMVQAVQRFVQYAVDEIHELGAYVSVDVFGECASRGFTTPYGQYWPAISNVADVICGMPYPDHFTRGSFGIKDPWNHPYETLYNWGERVAGRQKNTASPAVVRTWVQAYHVLHYVDPKGIAYDAANIEKEIRALFDAGLTGGYTTWLSTSSLEHYREKKDAFDIDYLTEYKLKMETFREYIRSDKVMEENGSQKDTTLAKQ